MMNTNQTEYNQDVLELAQDDHLVLPLLSDLAELLGFSSRKHEDSTQLQDITLIDKPQYPK